MILLTYRTVTTPNNSSDINSHSFQLDRRTDPRVYIVMEFLYGLVIALNVKICTRDSDLETVGEVPVECIGIHSVEKHLFNLVCIWVG